MSNKNLPIKIFEKRKIIDDRRIEGSGSNELPEWAKLNEEELTELVEEFEDTLSEIENKINKRPRDRDFIPAVIEVEMHKLATAKSHRSEIASLFNSNDYSNVIGYIDERNLLIKVNNSDVKKIKEKLVQKEKNKKGIASIIEMKPFEPRINVKNVNKKEPLKITLINFDDYELNQSVSNLFETICRKNQVSFKKVNYTPDLIIYRLANVSTDAFNEIKNFDALEKITVMPTYSMTVDDLAETKISIKIKKPVPGKTYPIVGILDTGIKDIPHLKPWLLPEKFTKIPATRIDYRHGTFVAGIIEYSDELDGQIPVGNSGCYLYDATVHPGDNDTIEEYELLQNITDAIHKKYTEIKIWNLSLGTRIESSETDFSDFGKTLDYLQESFGVLICKSAGNCDNFLHGRPVSRIANSADSLRSLVVGSIAHKKAK
ncbi:MAG TPA: S8 family serine peptidase, partial [Puia sp.]